MYRIFLDNEDGLVEVETGETVYDAVLYGAEEGNDIATAPAQETEAVAETVAVTEEAKAMPIGEAGVNAVLGYGVVFAGLLMLLAVISVMGAIFKASARKKAEKTAAAVEELPAAPAAEAKPAPGTAGEVKLFDVPDKDAAMIMAIVADKLRKPLNELRFISIKEVK